LQATAGGFQHQLFYDDLDTPIITDADRPALALGQSRPVRREWAPDSQQALHVTVSGG
jgi:hypothetical protein